MGRDCDHSAHSGLPDWAAKDAGTVEGEDDIDQEHAVHFMRDLFSASNTVKNELLLHKLHQLLIHSHHHSYFTLLHIKNCIQ